MQWFQRLYQNINLIYSSSISLLPFCAFPVVLSFKDQVSRFELQQYAALTFKFHSFNFIALT